jgi:hypothetical protein
MEALRHSKVLPEEGKKTMTTTRSSKLDIPLVVSMDWNLHIKDCSSQIKQLEKEAYTRKENHVCKYKKTLYGFKQLDANYLIYSRSVVKTFYDRNSVSEWLLRSPQ